MKAITKAKRIIRSGRKNFFIPNIVYVLCLGFLIRIVFSFFGTLHLDQGTFVSWGNILVTGGFKNFYNSWSDYLPGYLYVLYILGKINLTGIIPETVLFKLPAILSDLATGFIIYKILAKSKGEKWGIIAASVYIFNPAILYNSTLWGQVDSLTALTAVFSVYIFPVNLFASVISLAFGTLIKPQTAFILPVIIYLFIREKKKLSEFILYGLMGLTIFIGGFVPFWNHGSLLSFIFERLGISLNQYPYTSINAFNFWGLTGFWQPDNIYFQIAGYLLVLSATVFLIYKLRKIKNAEYLVMAFIFAASFTFFTRMHERHLLPVFAPLTIAAMEYPVFAGALLGFSLTYVANLYYSFIWITQDFMQVFSDFTIKFLSILNVAFSVSIFYFAINNLKMNFDKFSAKIKNLFNSGRQKTAFKLPKISLADKKARYILYGILAFAFVARIYSLGTIKEMYFDEVYHAFTAKVMMSSEANKAWEWWNTPPDGFAYEWTHPPLAKLGMVLGMSIFGQNSFGWRIPGALLGVGSVFLIYLIAKKLFKDEAVALLSAAVFSLDGLALVMSRIGMNDSYVLFFILLSIYLFIKEKNLGSAIAFGLAISSKWSAIWAVPILFILWIRRKNKFSPSIFWFLVIPVAIYLLTYTQMFLTGHDFNTWWGMQEQMWWYHTGLRATHPYSSPWWSWPLLIRPIYLYTSEEIGGMVGRIYAFGNPFVFWFGLASVFASLMYAYIERNKELGLIVFSYFIFFVPWALSPRIMFLYHYLPSIPFLAIATGYVLRRNPKLIWTYFAIALVLFVYFYPHYTGLQIPLWLDKSYYWVQSWR